MPSVILHINDNYDNHIYTGPIDDTAVPDFETPQGWVLRTYPVVDTSALTDATEQQLAALASGKPLV